MISRKSVLTNARFAGMVLRYHTWPTLQKQTVGDHTWQIFRIYWQILAKDNPYREGTKSRGWFAVYKDGMTVEAAIAAGTPRHHIRWDLVQGNIKVS